MSEAGEEVGPEFTLPEKPDRRGTQDSDNESPERIVCSFSMM